MRPVASFVGPAPRQRRWNFEKRLRESIPGFMAGFGAALLLLLCLRFGGLGQGLAVAGSGLTGWLGGWVYRDVLR